MVSQFIKRAVYGKATVLGEELLEALSRFEKDGERALRLIKRGADVNLRDNFGNTALHQVAMKDDTFYDVAVALLEKGADPNAKCPHGDTPLARCTRDKTTRMAELLVAHGALVALVEKDAAGRYAKYDVVDAFLCAAARKEWDSRFTLQEALQLKIPKLRLPKR